MERPLTPQQLSLVTYLACVGPARRETLIEALWGGQPISDARFANLVSDVRRAIGRHHLPAVEANHYRLVDVTTDLDLLRAAAPGHLAPEGELESMMSAMTLVRGPVFAAPTDRSWWWLDGHPEVVAQAEATVGQLTHRLVTALWRQGQLDQARAVCQRALACCPLDRELVLAMEGLHRAQGRPLAASRLITSWRIQVERLTGEDPLSAAPPVASAPAATAVASGPLGTVTAQLGPIDQASIGTAVTTTLPR
ncbi:MAG: tetratricopeptide repeat protein [Actinomycetota bacterium]